MCLMDSRPWNVPLPVFCRLVDASKIKSMIFLIEYSNKITESRQHHLGVNNIFNNSTIVIKLLIVP